MGLWGSCMNIIENKSKYRIEDMITLAERDGNKKRKYLLLNKLQAKYLPVDPIITIDMFDELFHQLDIDFTGKRVAVVGFAETATAIGSRVAEDIYREYCNDVCIIPTTRELLNSTCKTEFLEEHSHATEQILYTDAKHLNQFDYLIFVEDEVTTGNTICNCVKQLDLKCNVVVLSLLNCMDEDELDKFSSLGIKPYWLVRTTKDDFDKTEHGVSLDKIPELSELMPLYDAFSADNPRTGVSFYLYDYDLSKLSNLNRTPVGKTLVLGTEECMYPAIRYAAILKRKGYDVSVSATTRVPVMVGPECTLKERYRISSVYDSKRVSYVYNLSGYNTVIIVTDGKGSIKDLCNAAETAGCTNLQVVRLM